MEEKPCSAEWAHGRVYRHERSDGTECYERICSKCGRRWPASYGAWRAQKAARMGRCWKIKALRGGY